MPTRSFRMMRYNSMLTQLALLLFTSTHVSALPVALPATKVSSTLPIGVTTTNLSSTMTLGPRASISSNDHSSEKMLATAAGFVKDDHRRLAASRQSYHETSFNYPVEGVESFYIHADVFGATRVTGTSSFRLKKPEDCRAKCDETADCRAWILEPYEEYCNLLKDFEAVDYRKGLRCSECGEVDAGQRKLGCSSSRPCKVRFWPNLRDGPVWQQPPPAGECYLNSGRSLGDYEGKVAHSISGASCLAWKDAANSRYADLPGNYCRSPDDRSSEHYGRFSPVSSYSKGHKGPWCYVADDYSDPVFTSHEGPNWRPGAKWEYCDIVKCPAPPPPMPPMPPSAPPPPRPPQSFDEHDCAQPFGFRTYQDVFTTKPTKWVYNELSMGKDMSTALVAWNKKCGEEFWTEHAPTYDWKRLEVCPSLSPSSQERAAAPFLFQSSLDDSAPTPPTVNSSSRMIRSPTWSRASARSASRVPSRTVGTQPAPSALPRAGRVTCTVATAAPSASTATLRCSSRSPSFECRRSSGAKRAS